MASHHDRHFKHWDEVGRRYVERSTWMQLSTHLRWGLPSAHHPQVFEGQGPLNTDFNYNDFLHQYRNVRKSLVCTIIHGTNNRFSIWWIVENLSGILLLLVLAVPLVAWSWRICFTLFITLEEKVFQRNGRDVPEVKSWKSFQTKLFVKKELFSHFHHSCRHPLCSYLFSSELKFRPTLNLKEWPTLFTKSSLLE